MSPSSTADTERIRVEGWWRTIRRRGGAGCSVPDCIPPNNLQGRTDPAAAACCRRPVKRKGTASPAQKQNAAQDRIGQDRTGHDNTKLHKADLRERRCAGPCKRRLLCDAVAAQAACRSCKGPLHSMFGVSTPQAMPPLRLHRHRAPPHLHNHVCTVRVVPDLKQQLPLLQLRSGGGGRVRPAAKSKGVR